MKKMKNSNKHKKPQQNQSYYYSDVMKRLEESLTSRGLIISGQDSMETKPKSQDPTISVTFLSRSKKE